MGNCMGGFGGVDPQIVGYSTCWSDVGLLGMGNCTGGCDVDILMVGNCYQMMCNFSHTGEFS
jgi:hypothetical protein